MPVAKVNGVELYYEEAGSGFPLVWCHEYAGDYRSWEPQMRHFARRYRVITYSMRGYPPSSAPPGAGHYDIPTLAEDLRQLLKHLGIARTYLGGLSLGGNVVMNFSILHPGLVAGLILASTGSDAQDRDQFVREYGKLADETEQKGMGVLVDAFGKAAARQAFRIKDPRGWAEFLRGIAEHGAAAAAQLIREAVIHRKTVFELTPELAKLPMPTLVIVGDQDEPVHAPALHLRRTIPNAGLAFLPVSGHNINIEEPALFNLHVEQFLASVDRGRWCGWVASGTGR